MNITRGLLYAILISGASSCHGDDPGNDLN